MEELLTGAPQGSVLGPLLFNIYLKDLFYASKDTEICNFADDTSPHAGGFNLKDAMTDIARECSILVEWFRDKCHLIVSRYKCEAMYVKVGDALL